MRPQKGDIFIHVPLTFDVLTKSRALTLGKSLWVILAIIVWFIVSLFSLAFTESFKWFFPLIAFIFTTFVIRFIILHELFFKKKRKELMDNDYLFDFSVFWGIYQVDDRYPYFVHFSNGLKGVFIAFDKDVIVGKEEWSDFAHYEALADAYNQLAKRDIEFEHIDYMDIVGKDTRLDNLFRSASNVENEDLKHVLMHMYDYIGEKMSKAYSSYDVYCFYFRGKEELFWEDMSAVIRQFMQANYLRARALDKEGIGKLVKVVNCLNDFSVNKACEDLFKGRLSSDYLRPIWTEKDGDKIILNKTMEEIIEAKRVKEVEKVVKKGKKKAVKFNEANNEDIDLFD